MKKFLILSIAVLNSFYGQAQHSKKHVVNEEIRKAIETGVFDGLVEPTDPDETAFYTPKVPRVIPKNKNGIPSDAIVLFDGTSFEEWERGGKNKKVTWKLDKKEKSMTVDRGNSKKGTSIKTKKKFGSIQLHIEWRSPIKITENEQKRGNSGVFLQGRYEVQILDNNNNETYANGQVGAVYKQSAPLAMASVPTGEWNTYDIIFHEPKFENGKKIKSGTITILHNGILIQDHFKIKGSTAFRGWPKNKAHAKESIVLQDHQNPVSFRNIWVRELKD